MDENELDVERLWGSRNREEEGLRGDDEPSMLRGEVAIRQDMKSLLQ